MNGFLLRLIILPILLSCVTITGTCQRGITLRFSTDSFALDSVHKQMISSFLDSIELEPNTYRYDIIGHTDNVGAKSYNDTLSKNRANSVSTYLTKFSNNKNDIFVDFKGFNSPESSNTSEKGKALNRRVELIIQTWDKFLYSSIKSKIPSRLISFENKDGLQNDSTISVCEGAFIDANGELVTGKIDLFYQEYRTTADFIGLNKPLSLKLGEETHYYQSGGMYYLSATHQGNSVYLQKDCLKVNFIPNDTLPYQRFIFESQELWVPIPDLITSNPNAQSDAKRTLSKNENLRNALVSAQCELSCPELIEYLSDLYAKSNKVDEVAFPHAPSLEKRFIDINYQGGVHFSTLKKHLSSDSVFTTFIVPIKSKFNRIFFTISVSAIYNKQLIPVPEMVFRTNSSDFEKIVSKAFSDFRLQQINGGYQLMLKDSIQFTEVPVIFYDRTKIFRKKLSKRKHQNLFSEYQGNLELTEHNFGTNSTTLDSAQCFQSMLATFFPKSENELATEDWKDLFECQKAIYSSLLKPLVESKDTICKGNQTHSGGSRQSPTHYKRPSTVSNLGLYNLDILHKLSPLNHITIDHITDELGEPINVKASLLHNSDKNLLFNVNFYDFWIEQNSNNCLIIFDLNGSIFTASNSAILNQSGTLILKKIGSKEINLVDLQKFIEESLNE